jgi:HIV-1 Vpr-binding protein
LQATKFPPEVIQDNIELLLECLPNRMSWRPVSDFMRLGGIQLLMQLVAMATDWITYTGK